MRQQIKYHLRTGLNGTGWRPKDTVWKTGTKVKVFMRHDGAWVYGTIVGWLSPQQ